MALALGRRLSIEQIQRETKALIKKNDELLDRWKEQHRRIRTEVRAKKPAQK